MTRALLLAALAAAPAAAESGSSPVAGGVVSSREWRVKRAPEKEEEFIGDVRYKSGLRVLEADWARYRHKEDRWQAKGRVRFTESFETGEVVRASGDEAALDRKSGQGSLAGRSPVRFSRVPPEGGAPDEGQAGRLDWSGREEALLSGGVLVWGPRIECGGDSALYNRTRQSLKLWGGRPVLRRVGPMTPEDGPWTGAVKADSILASRPEGRVDADGKAQGWIVFPKESAK